MIDAHQHFWDRSLPFNYEWLKAPDKRAICRNYLPEDLQPLLASRGIGRSIFVQTQHQLAENRWVLEQAEKHPFIAGVVGWVDLSSPDCEQQLAEFQDHPKFVGIRHITHDEPDDDFIVRPDVLRGLKVLEKHRMPFDLLFYVRHLKHADTLGRMFPNLPLVIDHLAKPRIREQVVADWLPHLRAAARHPNIHCKLSGLITEADWNHWKAPDLRPYVHAALECFGPSRCMYGSDWPVSELAGNYGQVFDALNEALGELSSSDREQIFSGTAEQFYGLPRQ